LKKSQWLVQNATTHIGKRHAKTSHLRIVRQRQVGTREGKMMAWVNKKPLQMAIVPSLKRLRPIYTLRNPFILGPTYKSASARDLDHVYA